MVVPGESLRILCHSCEAPLVVEIPTEIPGDEYKTVIPSAFTSLIAHEKSSKT
jgi:hypothetical protein